MKLQKTVTGGSSVITDYAGNFVYEGGNLQFLNHSEGYIEPDGSGGYDYVYQCKDHLGNIRLSFADDNGDGNIATSEIREENNYYPFGLKHMGYKGVANGRNHKYGYGGKEEQDELDLAWLDITARNYDPALGRWMNIDPLADQMRRHSPYNYAFDNPIYFTDPDGMAPEGSNEGGQSNDSSTQYRVEDEYGNVVTMNSEQLAEYITANGVTEDFDGSGLTTGNNNCCDGLWDSIMDAFGWGQAEDQMAQSNGSNLTDDEIESRHRDRVSRAVGEGTEALKELPVAAVPDAIGFHVGGSGVAFIGGETDVQALFVLKGDDASFIPVISINSGGTLADGVDVSLSMGLDIGYYNGNAKNSTLDLAGRYYGSEVGFTAVGGGSVGYTYSVDNEGKTTWRFTNLNISAGVDASPATGANLKLKGGQTTIMVGPN